MKAVQPERSEVSDLNERCFDWVTPDELQDTAEKLGELLGDSAMLRPGRCFREAYIASRFAKRRGASRVRLLKEMPPKNMPDFEIFADNSILKFETTEADIPGRRRQDEYRRPRKAEPMIFTSLDVMVEHIRLLAKQKAAKAYEDCQGLLIWMNPPAFSFQPELRWESLVRAGEPAANAFPEVWIMRGSGSLLWKNGQPQLEVPGEEF